MDVSDHEDPRISGEYVRRLSGGPDPVTLVGVVHDHPASTYRVRQLAEREDPDTLALELPPMAVGLFEQYAESERTPPEFGGEMSAAIQAADTERRVGIDRPTVGYFERLLGRVLRERPPAATVQKVFSNAVSTTKHAVACRLAGAVAAGTSIRLEVDFPVAHDADRSDSPPAQARDERKQIRQSRAFMNAVGGGSTSRASQFEDGVREQHMAEHLAALRRDGTVLAVVGIDHLDPLAERLDDATGAHASPP